MGLKRMGRRHEGPEHDTQRPRWRTVWSEEPSTSQVRLWCGKAGELVSNGQVGHCPDVDGLYKNGCQHSSPGSKAIFSEESTLSKPLKSRASNPNVLFQMR